MSRILHSIHGKLLGLDVNNYLTQGEAGAGLKFPQIWVGTSGSEVAMLDTASLQSLASGSSATAITAGGVTVLTSAETTWTLAAPVVGSFKTIKRNSISTGTTGVVSFANGSVMASTIVWATAATINGGAAIQLYGIASTSWALVGTYGNVVWS